MGALSQIAFIIELELAFLYVDLQRKRKSLYKLTNRYISHCNDLSHDLVMSKLKMGPETPTGSEFLSFFVLYSRILADFLSLLGKWVKLIKFEAENEFFCTWKVEKPQSTTSTP